VIPADGSPPRLFLDGEELVYERALPEGERLEVEAYTPGHEPISAIAR
jgi:hypothetical protein